MSKGRFGIHGGQYIPETLMNAINELEEAYEHYKNDEEFMDSLKEIYGEDCEKHFNEVLRPLGLLPRQ